jgi:hypothetical protein
MTLLEIKIMKCSVAPSARGLHPRHLRRCVELLDWTPRDTPRPGIHLGIGKTVYTMLVLTSKIRQVCAVNSHLIVILEGEEAKTRLAQQL